MSDKYKQIQGRIRAAAPLSIRLKLVREQVMSVISGNERPQMCVPPTLTDTDINFVTAIDDAIEMEAEHADLTGIASAMLEYLSTCAENEHPDMSAVIYGWMVTLKALNDGGADE